MLTLTDRTERALLDLIETGRPEPGQTLRLIRTPDGLSVTFDQPRVDDHVVSDEGTPMLIVSRALEAELEGLAVDCEETDDGFRLFTRPRS